MITQFSLQHFKSYKQAHFPLGVFTVMIGANASGKSNALEALRILNRMACGQGLDDIERDLHNSEQLIRGQSADLFYQGADIFTIQCQIDNAPEEWRNLSIGIQHNGSLSIASESIYKSDNINLYEVNGKEPYTDVLNIKYNNFASERNATTQCMSRQAVFYQLESPGHFEEKYAQSRRIIPAVVKSFREQLKEMLFLEPVPAKMRDYAYKDSARLKEDGSNLSSVIYKLCEDEACKASLLSFIKSLPEQDIKDLRFIETPRNEVMVQLVESFGHVEKQFDAPLLSDGTLRVLAIGAALLSVPSDTLVVIEEIDNGIHPSRAQKLVEQMIEIAKARNINLLVTSHNPALLDAVPDESLHDVLCCYRDPNDGDSKVIALAQLEEFPELMAHGSLGDVVTRNILDRYLKSPVSKETKQAAWDAWFSMMEASE